MNEKVCFTGVLEECVDLKHIWSVLIVLVHVECEINSCEKWVLVLYKMKSLIASYPVPWFIA